MAIAPGRQSGHPVEAGPVLMGHVFDESGRPIANARIVHGPDEFDPLSAQTDANGSFSMANIEGAISTSLSAHRGSRRLMSK